MQFFPRSGRIDTAIWMHYMDANKTYGEKACLLLHKNAASNIEQVLEAAPQKSTSCTVTYHPSRKLSKLDEPDMYGTAGEVGANSCDILM